MAEEVNEPVVESSRKSFINPKIFLIGLPLFIVQLVIVYFVTVNILLSKVEKNNTSDTGENSEEYTDSEIDSANDNSAEFVYNIEDVFINPAGTKGQRIMLLSLGFAVASEEHLAKLNDKNLVIKDLVISTISSKTLSELSDFSKRGQIKVELSGKVSDMFPGVEVKNVYFSKYIIQ